MIGKTFKSLKITLAVLFVTLLTFGGGLISSQNVWAQDNDMDLEEMMENIMESTEITVKQDIKQAVRQETNEAVTAGKIEPNVEASGNTCIQQGSWSGTFTDTADCFGSAPFVSGTWSGTVDSSCNFTSSATGGGQTDTLTGSISGNAITMSFTDIECGLVSGSGTMTGTSLTNGSYSGGGLVGNWSGSKQ